MKNEWRDEVKGTYCGLHTYCPEQAYGDCPYCDQCNICHIEDPMLDCDDFYSYYTNWDDWYSWHFDLDEEEEEESEEDVELPDFGSKYTPTLDKFLGLLEDLQVPLPTIENCFDGFKMTWPKLWKGDVIIHSGSIGHENGMVESFKFPWDKDDVTGASVEEMAWNLHQLFQGA